MGTLNHDPRKMLTNKLKHVLLEIDKNYTLNERKIAKQDQEYLHTSNVFKRHHSDVTKSNNEHFNSSRKHQNTSPDKYRGLERICENLKSTNSKTYSQEISTDSQDSSDKVLLEVKNILLSTSHIVDSSSDVFNDMIKRMKLTGDQLTLIKDIRRRGKNKIAAQICRKRKIDSIDSLSMSVESLLKKEALLDEDEDSFENEIVKYNMKFDNLYNELKEFRMDFNNPLVIGINKLNEEMKHINTRSEECGGSVIELSETTFSRSNSTLNSSYEEELEIQNSSNVSKSFYIENLIKKNI